MNFFTRCNARKPGHLWQQLYWCKVQVQRKHRLKQIIMRTYLTAFVIALAFLNVAANVRGQQVTLKAKNATLNNVFAEIKKQTGYLFWYEDNLLNKTNKVNLDLKNASLNQALEVCLKNQPIEYSINDKTIMLRAKEKGFIDRLIDALKAIDIKGRVVDEQNQPLPGASVTIKGTNHVVTANNNGEFNFSNVAENTTLVISYIGYQTRELKAGKEMGNIALQQANNQLDQVQVQGYGVTTQRLATGNIATIKAETIAQQPVTNPLQALSGRMAGVQVIQGSGLPGNNIEVQIRGRNSIAASNKPLFIVDGVPFVAESFGAANTVTFVGTSPLNSIPPENIESISVLKDADATAIYGSRAANGVVLITTKKGVAGKTKLDVNLNRGFSSVTRTATPMSTEQYLELRRNAFANSNITPTATNAPDLMAWDQSLDNNLQDWYMGNTAQALDATASVSGGSQQVQFRISGNYHKESTIFSDKDKYRRGNMNVNIAHRSNDQKFSLNFSGIYTSDNNHIQNGVVGSLLNVAKSVPNYPIYDNAGNYNWLSGLNNFHALSTAYWKGNTDNLNANLTSEYKVSHNLSIKGSLGYNKMYHESMRPQPSTSSNPTSSLALGLNTFSSDNIRNILFEPQLLYTPYLLGNSLSILLGSTVQQRTSSTDMLVKTDYPDELLVESKNFGTLYYGTGSKSEYKYLSLFSRINYNIQNRYIVNINFRRDGSSRFGPGKQFGNFGSIGGAWIFSKENFIEQNLQWLSYGKLRASYGTTGSDGIGDYAYLSLYNTTTPYGTLTAFNPSQIGNNEYRWEVNKKLEVALDLGFVQDRILFNTAWYRNRSGNQLVTYPLPTTTGFTGYTANLPAVVENTGWEFELNTENIQKSAFKWTSSLNLTLPKNRLVSFPNLSQTSYANSLIIGQSLNSVLGYRFIGIDPLTGIPSVVDVDNNGVISTNSSYNNQGGDRIWLGTTDPKWFAGFSNSFSFKGLRLGIFLQYTKQKKSNLYSTDFSRFGTLANYWTAHLDYWKKPNDGSTLPKPFANTNSTNGLFDDSDYAFSDASFFRLKNIALSYDIPQHWVKKAGFSKLTVYANGQNVLTLTDFIGYDPEAGTTSLPQLKTITFGLKTNF